MAAPRRRSPVHRVPGSPAADAITSPAQLTVTVTPSRQLIVALGERDASDVVPDASERDSAPPVAPDVAARIARAFGAGSGAGLLELGAAEPATPLPPALGFWRDFGARYVAAVCARGDATGTPLAPPDETSLAALAAAAPPMIGGEYVDAALLAEHWAALDGALAAALADHGGSVARFLQARHAAWNLVGRVHFNLAENRRDDDAPFAFLATYTTRLTARATAQHVPLGQALREYAGARARSQLAQLLAPVRRAADGCPWLAEMVERGELFHPLRWSTAEAGRLLADLPRLEAAGVVVRMPAGWAGKRPSRPQATATVGARPTGRLGGSALLDFRTAVTLDGEPLSQGEITELLASTDGLRLLRGRWIELDRAELRAALDRMRALERAAADGLGFADAMRLVAGVALDEPAAGAAAARPRVIAGPWLAETLAPLRSPAALAAVDPGPALHAELRPYQAVGVRWLHALTQLGLGACLADDMGLGKTMQVIALLLAFRRGAVRTPSLLVAPASLIGNWTAELARFAPGLSALVAHPSVMPAGELAAATRKLAGVDLVITSYGTLPRVPWLSAARWGLAIVDEAQAIKNPGTRQTRAVKALDAHARVALTGTPVENRLGDLWSIFDFLNPGLLGTAKDFARYIRQLDARGYGPLRELIRPYLLRRLKTDRSVITDLPDKTELTAYCALSRKQAALYQQAVDDLAATLRGSRGTEQSELEGGGPAHSAGDAGAKAPRGIERRGAVLAALLRFKQICNHPSHWLGDGDWREADSGKLQRVREIAEVIAAKQDKLLVFTQFREACEPLAAFLAPIFGRSGLILHGDTPVKQRSALVRQFQDGDAPFFVLSLKAGGTGLNLTAAAHVLHFDRWWNPAVEDQATDRAFRIGQRRNVLVHKLVCRGTVEDKIDALITDKRALSQQLLEGGAELKLTELPDSELMALVRLDLQSAMMDGTTKGESMTEDRS